MSRGLAYFLLNRYLMAAWSVYTITFEPIKYDLNLLIAKTMARSSFYVMWLSSLFELHLELE
jgi:hypothetical protein